MDADDELAASDALSRLVETMEANRQDMLFFDARTAVDEGAAVSESIMRASDYEAYRVGMFVTWPARRVYRMLKCYRENGLKYTLRRLILGKGRGRE